MGRWVRLFQGGGKSEEFGGNSSLSFLSFRQGK